MTTAIKEKTRKPRATKFSEAKDQTRTIFITPTAKAQLADAIYEQLGEKLSLSDLLEHIARGNIVVSRTAPDKAKIKQTQSEIKQAQSELNEVMSKLEKILAKVSTKG